jgi:hypothetical protein
MTVLLAKRLVRAGEERRFEVRHQPGAGWQTTEASGPEKPQTALYTDWHRVERVLRRFSQEITELHREGWFEAEIAG